ncbi:phosphatase PAP2 family protein [Glaciihabitans sp. UYNi722]|uniref:phosphatase PAP2 family protein n=1 Tax=Glaciihabitans sp. UYNi722 TaxID=3156344 RepID=UPI0033997561
MATAFAVRSARPGFAVIGVLGILSVFASGYLIHLYFGSTLPAVDAAWHGFLQQHRSAWLEYPSLALNLVGGTIAMALVTVAVMAVFFFLRRRWAAMFIGLSVGVSFLLSTVIKQLVDRQRPADNIVVAASGSFPSGHTTAAAAIVVALALVLARRWVWMLAVVWILAMAFSRTYLFAHWLSDTAAGAVLGVSVALLLWTPVAARLRLRRSP